MRANTFLYRSLISIATFKERRKSMRPNTFLYRFLISIATLLIAAQSQFAAASGHLEKEVIIASTGGTFERIMKELFFEPFTKATGVAVRIVTANPSEQFAKAKAMASAGNIELDIFSSGLTHILANSEPVAKLDCGSIPGAAANGVPGTCREHGLLQQGGAVVLTYNTSVFPTGKHPRGWVDFWDVNRFPGPRALPNAGAPWTVLTAALLADGVPPEKLFPLDLDRAFRKLEQLRRHVKVWWKTGDQSQQIIRNNEVVMSAMWSGRALSLKAAGGTPVDVEWNQALRDSVWWSIMKGAPHPKAAQAFLNFYMERPEAHVEFAKRTFYDTSNVKAVNLFSPEEGRSRMANPDNWKRTVDSEHPWVIENRARLIERWNIWLGQ